MSKELIETLDALNNERPGVLKLKRKHFDLDKYETATKRERLEWMRLNAEKDRVDKFKEVALGQTKHYYNVLEIFAKMLDKRKSSEEIEPVTNSD